MICGVILKEFSFDLGLIKGQKKEKGRGVAPINEAKTIVQACTKEIISSLSHENAEIEIWESYIKAINEIRKFKLMAEERSIYEDNEKYTDRVVKYYINFLIDNSDQLVKKNIQPLLRVRSEFQLNHSMYGGEKIAICVLLTHAFENIYRYYLFGKFTDDEINGEVAKKIDLFKKLSTYLHEGSDKKELIIFSNQALGEMMHDYRRYFIIFGDLKGEIAEERPLSPEVSEKIRGILEKNQT
jgi:hypothetical protein